MEKIISLLIEMKVIGASFLSTKIANNYLPLISSCFSAKTLQHGMEAMLSYSLWQPKTIIQLSS